MAIKYSSVPFCLLYICFSRGKSRNLNCSRLRLCMISICCGCISKYQLCSNNGGVLLLIVVQPSDYLSRRHQDQWHCQLFSSILYCFPLKVFRSRSLSEAKDVIDHLFQVYTRKVGGFSKIFIFHKVLNLFSKTLIGNSNCPESNKVIYMKC